MTANGAGVRRAVYVGGTLKGHVGNDRGIRSDRTASV